MAYALNNVTTEDAYTERTTLRCPQGRVVNIDVGAGASIFYQLGQGIGGVEWGTEVFAVGGVARSMVRRADAVRVRSGAPAAPAQVTVVVTVQGEQ